MARIKYKYNSETLRYEPWRLKGKALRLRSFILFGISLALALVAYSFYIQYVGSFDEIILKQKNQTLKVEWQLIQDRTHEAYAELYQLIDKDDNNYRVILDAEPLQPSERQAGVGGSVKLETKEFQDFPIVLNNYTSVMQLKRQLDVEVQSYGKLKSMIEDKLEAWASRPAIQPISNKELSRLHMTYGTRYHPIFHKYMAHNGLDFAAPKGTPVYATGDGKVIKAYFSGSYGNVVYIDHRYNFETRYAHLSGFAVQEGEAVKRGQVIGYVGSTGNSVASHLHYEVLYKGQHVHPINFFQRDLSNREYQKLIEIGSQQEHPLD
ncbi:MAG TPA: M23 family metallopeptidase [Ohtaekwangia sp.]|uniref:M23 family metallopeptidase n=1 Tax=Ohtaekwangia sp. TaxID=2066019 RepID=UPI002F92A704